MLVEVAEGIDVSLKEGGLRLMNNKNKIKCTHVNSRKQKSKRSFD